MEIESTEVSLFLDHFVKVSYAAVDNEYLRRQLLCTISDRPIYVLFILHLRQLKFCHES